MNRSKEILITCHCLLNSNAKIYPLAETGGMYVTALEPYVKKGVGLVQLPCPETCYLGMNRWGMTKEQFNHLSFRKFCRTLLEPTLLQISAFIEAGYNVIGIAGMDGSPNCGITKTCKGFTGGEICSDHFISAQCDGLQFTPGMGVFMDILHESLKEMGISIPFLALHNEPSI